MRSLLTAAVILWFVVSHIAVADDRPSGIPDEAKYVKVDRVTDGDTIVLVDSTSAKASYLGARASLSLSPTVCPTVLRGLGYLEVN